MIKEKSPIFAKILDETWPKDPIALHAARASDTNHQFVIEDFAYMGTSKHPEPGYQGTWYAFRCLRCNPFPLTPPTRDNPDHERLIFATKQRLEQGFLACKNPMCKHSANKGIRERALLANPPIKGLSRPSLVGQVFNNLRVLSKLGAIEEDTPGVYWFETRCESCGDVSRKRYHALKTGRVGCKACKQVASYYKKKSLLAPVWVFVASEAQGAVFSARGKNPQEALNSLNLLEIGDLLKRSIPNLPSVWRINQHTAKSERSTFKIDWGTQLRAYGSTLTLPDRQELEILTKEATRLAGTLPLPLGRFTPPEPHFVLAHPLDARHLDGTARENEPVPEYLLPFWDTVDFDSTLDQYEVRTSPEGVHYFTWRRPTTGKVVNAVIDTLPNEFDGTI